ncbi:MAG: phosphonate metabolism transcriptional regulator PhnF [Cyanobacteria bacterium P01_A01_bin.3]
MRSPLDPSPIPLYVRIAEQLRHDIQIGMHAIGDRLPTETQLSERFDVNRHTLRRAIGLLKDEGLLRVERGRGTFVAAPPIRYPIGKRVRYNEMLKAHGLQGSYKLLRAMELPADASVAKHLAIKFGEMAIAIDRVGYADDQPIHVASSYFPKHRFPNLLEFVPEMRSISKLLMDKYDCDHLRQVTTVSARTVKPQDARLLGLPLNHPILLVESVNVDREGKPIEYGVTRLRGDSMELVFENQLDASTGQYS